MEKEFFYNRYIQRKKASNNFQDMRQIIGFMKELLGYGKEAILFMQIVEKELLDAGIVSFQINGSADINKLEPFDTDGKKAQMYLYEAMRIYNYFTE